MLLGAFLLSSGVTISLLLAVVGLMCSFYLIRVIVKAPAGDGRMKEVASAIEEGAKAYLNRQVATIGVIAVVIFLLAVYFKGWPTAWGFLIGAACSLAAGFIGMRIAVLANVRTAQAAGTSRHGALCMAFNGGAVTGLLVVGLALLSVGLFYLVAVKFAASEQIAINSLIGLALGSSLISVFARLGGGIYTKAADVGADLVGKIESHLDEDDPRNPATIADNVGDNVGDCAGMAADVFETYAVSLIGAILIGALTLPGYHAAIVYPFLLGGVSVIGAVLGILFVNMRQGEPGRLLLGAVGINSALSAVLYLPITYGLFPQPVTVGNFTYTAGGIYMASLVGLVLTGAIVLITNYYTSTSFSPVRKIALASETGHATNIIAGLATGQRATALPVVCIGAAILLSYHWGEFYGIAVAVMSMLSMAGIIISLDAFGPITDNAGGVAVMSDLPHSVRGRHRRTRRGRQHHESRHERVRHRLGRVGRAGVVPFLRRGTQAAPGDRRASEPAGGGGIHAIPPERPARGHRVVHRRRAAICICGVQHGRGRQCGWRGGARGASAVGRKTGHPQG